MNDITILITTFNRDELLESTINNIKQYMPCNSMILIGDQNPTKEKLYKYEDTNVFYYKLPYDSGLSYSRNFLVNEAYEFGCPYILMMADSIRFTQKCDFNPIMDFLESNPDYAIVGCELLNSKCPWEFCLEKKDKILYYTKSNDYVVHNNITYKQVDICRNIFLAKTEALLDLWDNELKLSEHTVAFWNLKQKGYKVFWTNHLVFNRVTEQNNPEYDKYRKRVGEYRKLAYQKLGIERRIFVK